MRPVQHSTIRERRETQPMKLMMPGQPYTANSVPANPVGAVQRSARHGEQPNCNRAEPMPELASKSRWCDQSIHDAGHSDVASGRLEGRFTVWNSRRGNHLGQRSCASASTGRTYGRGRSDQSTANHLARRGPSTYGYTASPSRLKAFCWIGVGLVITVSG
jgi:hypothetical protein